MDRKSIRERIIEMVIEKLGVNKEEITDETKFKENLGADSLDITELVMAIEDEWKIGIPDEDLEGISKNEDMTFAAILEYVCEKLGID